MIPTKIFYTKGVGVHREKLASFEMALRVAGLAHCNLVLVSSIFPPGCKVVSKEEGLKALRPGEIVFAIYDRESTNEPNRLIAASVGVAIPADPSMHGYLSEHHSFGETDEKAGEYAEDRAGLGRERTDLQNVRKDCPNHQYYSVGHRQQRWPMDDGIFGGSFCE